MRKNILRFVSYIIVTSIVSMGVLKACNSKDIVKIKSVTTENDKTIIELTDKSFAIIENEEYHFQPVDMGDWDYEFNNKFELDKAMKTYIENCNN